MGKPIVQEIIEISHFAKALKKIKFNTMVVLDLDNTVMTHRVSLGGDAWFESIFSHVAEKNLEPKTSRKAILSVYNTMQSLVRTEAVEPKIPLIIKALQHIGIPVVGLTARGKSIQEQTLQQLSDMGVDLPVIFCSGKHKGEALRDELLTWEQKPTHILMLDDKAKHLENVMHTLKDMEISFHGFHYGFLQEHVKAFRMEQAGEELADLWHWLPENTKKDAEFLGLISDEDKGRGEPQHYRDCFFHPKPSLASVVEDNHSGLRKSR